ncbi:MAG: NapC/NirT family cytochrome c, partial [Anaerohalosphaera sp.]|nr:NapC/NirT family cytochrome c [Anaerohalosphaera sp.]
MIIHIAKKIWKFARKRGPAFITGLATAVICYFGISWAIEPTSKSSYCGSACHEMNISYQTWELSSHGSNNFGIRVECVDCHLPPKENFFTHVTAKAHA